MSKAWRDGKEIDTRKFKTNAIARKAMPGMQYTRDIVVAVDVNDDEAKDTTWALELEAWGFDG